MLNFKHKVTPQNAFGPGLTEKQKAERIASQAKRLQELKDSARKLVVCDQFKEFKAQYAAGREALVEIFKGLEPKDHAEMIKVQAHLEVFDDLLAIEEKAK